MDFRGNVDRSDKQRILLKSDVKAGRCKKPFRLIHEEGTHFTNRKRRTTLIVSMVRFMLFNVRFVMVTLT